MFRKKLKLIVGVGCCAGLAVAGSSYYSATKKSLLFIGESKNYETQYDELLGIPATKIMPLFGEGIITLTLGQGLKAIDQYDYVVTKSRNAFYKLKQQFPECFIADLGLASVEKSLNNTEEAHLFYEKAMETARNNPKWTNSLSFLLPKSFDEFMNPAPGPEASMKQLHDQVWVVNGPFTLEDNVSVGIQSSIVRLEDQKSLVLINPTEFPPNIQEQINQLGTVEAIVTPCSPHGAALERCHSKIWPEARLFGTDPDTKHSFPNLNWTGFFTKDGLIQVDQAKVQTHLETPEEAGLFKEFDYIPLNGHLILETAFYHKPSKSLLGLTDMALLYDPSMSESVSWNMKAYSFSLGLVKPPFTSSKIQPQNYHYLFTQLRRPLLASVQNLLSLQPERVIFGHGGIASGVEQSQETLQNAFRWVTNPAPSGKPVGNLEGNILGTLWLMKFNLTRLLGTVAYARYKDVSEKK